MRVRRVLVFSAVAVAFVAGAVILAPRVVAQPSQPPAWSAGTWTVVCKEQLTHACGKEPGAKSTHLWTVTAKSTKEINVKVVGDSEFPELAGRYDANQRAFVFEGRAKEWFAHGLDRNKNEIFEFYTATFFRMSLTKKDQAEGLRRWSGFKSVAPRYPGMGTKAYAPCAIHSTCTAKRAD